MAHQLILVKSFVRHCTSSVRSYHARSDREQVSNFLLTLHLQNERWHVWRYLEAKTRNLIEHPMNWRVIQHLAKSLLEHRTMTGEQVVSAIREGFALENKRRVTKRAKAA